MLNISLLLRVLLIVCLLGASILANADAPSTVTKYAVGGHSGYLGSTRQEACDLYLPAFADTKSGSVDYGTYRADTNRCEYFRASDGASWGQTGATVQAVTSSVCADGSAPDTSKPLEEQCSPPTPQTCPYGSIPYGDTCEPIQCADGFHFGRDPTVTATEINRCIEDCPANTIQSIDQTTHIQWCLPMPEEADDLKESDGPTCPDTYTHVGFDGAGKAICRAGPQTDPCPAGTHNISADPAAPNCMQNDPSPPTTTQEEKHPETTTTNPDGSTTKTNTSVTTYPDGSKLTGTTTQTTHPDGRTTTNTTYSCSRQGACGGFTGTGGGAGGGGSGTGQGEGEGKADNAVKVQGDLYTKGTKTFTQVFQNFTSTVGASPVIAGATNFFTVNISGGSCPNWSVNVPVVEVTISLGDYFCSGILSDVIHILGLGLMLGAAWVAFRIAFL